MTRIRPPVRGFGPVAPGGGAVVGAALQGAGQALGAISDLRTNLELFDIREQEQIDRLEQTQFEKVERSEAIAQFTAKQIARNETAAQILNEADKARDYGSVQGDMDEWEKSFNQDLFSNRSQEFQDIFESIDRSARVGRINTLGTAVQAGNLKIIKDNYQIAADNSVESVNASSDPAEIVEFFDDLDSSMVDMGMTRDAIDAVVGDGLREAIQRYVRSLPLVDGLVALSDENVAQALGEKRRELLRRDLNTKASTLAFMQKLTSAAHERITGFNIADALRQGESATSLSSRIVNDERLSPTQQGDMLDFIDAVSILREQKPRTVDPEVIRTNEALTKGLIGRHIREAKLVRGSKKTDEEKMEALLEISNEAILDYWQAVLQEAAGEFRPSELIKRKFEMDAIIEDLLVVEEIEKQGFFAKLMETAAFVMPPAFDFTVFSRGGAVVSGPDFRVPNAIVLEEIEKMFLGEGHYGEQSSVDKASIELFLINQAINTDGSGKPLPREEAQAMAQKIFAEVEKRFLIEEKGVNEESIEEVRGLTFKTGTPATEARQQPDISEVADGIRNNLSKGRTIAEIEEFARGEPRFSQEVFDRALAAVGAEPEPELESLREPRAALRTSQSGIDFIKKMEGFIGKARTILNEDKPTGGFGRNRGFEVGEEITLERGEELLREDIAIAESDVEAVIPNSEKLSESEFNALVSLLLNIGRPEFEVSKAAAALNEALSGDTINIDALRRFLFEAFDKDEGFVHAGGVKEKGLVNRRAAEKRLFLSDRRIAEQGRPRAGFR